MFINPVLFAGTKNVDLRPTIIVPETENKTAFPFIVLKPAGSAVGSDGSFLFAAYTRKNVLSHIARHRCHESSPHRTRIATKLGERMLHYDESPRCQG